MPLSRANGKRKANTPPRTPSPRSSSAKGLDDYDPEGDDHHPEDHILSESPKRKKRRTAEDLVTPQRRVEKDAPRRQPAEDITKLVAEIAPHGVLCSVLYTEGSVGSVQKMHALQRALSYLKPVMMTALERHLKLPPGSLNLDTRWNQEFADATMHWCHDNGGYAVIPMLVDLEKALAYFKRNRGRRTADMQSWGDEFIMPETGWENIFLTLDMNTRHTLFRKVPEQDPVTKEWQERPEHSTHHHPYHSFGIIYSHIHPYFRILDAYFKGLQERQWWSAEQKKCAKKILAIADLLLQQDAEKEADQSTEENSSAPIAARTRRALREKDTQADAPTNAPTQLPSAQAGSSTQSNVTRASRSKKGKRTK